MGACRTLKELLERRMAEPPDTVTIAPPDVELRDPPSQRRINLFLYRVTENPHLKNLDRNAHPAAYGRPPLALDLHLLVTAYGDRQDEDEAAHVLLGDAMGVLHDHALIHARDPAYQDVLDPSLEDAFEQLKIVLEPLDLEELSKVWTALTAPYRLSAAYVVSVVQVDSERPRRHAPLVLESPTRGPRVQVVVLRTPHVRSVHVRRPGDDRAKARLPYATIGDTLVIQGEGFGDARGQPDLVVVLGRHEVRRRDLLRHADDTLELRVPDAAQLQPGTLPVRVTTRTPQGHAFSSNQVPLNLVPRVDRATYAAPAGDGPATVELEGARLFAPRMECLAIVGSGAAAQVVRGADYEVATQQRIVVPLAAPLPAGRHPLRVRVGGVENVVPEEVQA